MAASVYNKSAQLVTIKARGHQHPLLLCSLWNYIYKHEKFVSPDIVINDPQATLVIVTPTYAVFCITPPEVNVINVSKHPFTVAAQATLAKQLIIVPTQSFHQLADKVGDPKVKVGLVLMTARCGSTLLTQMMHRVPKERCSADLFCSHIFSDRDLQDINRILSKASLDKLYDITSEDLEKFYKGCIE